MKNQKLKKPDKKYLFIILVILSIFVCSLFVLYGLNAKNFDYNFPRRMKKVIAISLTGSAIAISTLIFQTITNNKVLSPSIMGLDSLYQFIQTVIVYVFGSQTLTMMTKYQDFALSTCAMIAFSLLLFKLIFKRGQTNIFVLVLVGMVFGTLFRSLSTFMQAIIDPNEFLILQGKMFASFNNVNSDLLTISIVIIVICYIYIFARVKQLDVLALGRENAIGLGINFDRQVLIYLAIIALLISVSTALVGPITFLGVMVVNLSRQLLSNFRHSLNAAASSLIAVIALIGGQFMVERIFGFTTTVSVIINFVGGIYFILLLLKER